MSNILQTQIDQLVQSDLQQGQRVTNVEGHNGVQDKRMTAIENQIDRIIIASGQDNPEIVQARGEFTKLNDRLNDSDTKLGTKVNKTDVSESVSQNTIVQRNANGNINVGGAVAFHNTSANNTFLGALIIDTDGKAKQTIPGQGATDIHTDMTLPIEPGTWTPIIIGSQSSATYTYSKRSGYYTRVGSQVTVYMDLSFTYTGTGAGYFCIQGLPFACSTDVPTYTGTIVYSAVTLNGTNTPFKPDGIAYLQATNRTIYLRKSSATLSEGIGWNEFPSPCSMWLTITYKI